MTRPTVYAVMKATIEVHVRSSSAEETLEQMHAVAKREAEDILRNSKMEGIRVIGAVEFSHAVIKESK
jgi:hypothetical protein